MSFGQNLRMLRREMGLTQSDLGTLLGTTKQVISRYELGTRVPKITVVRGYAERLRVPLSSLLGDSETSGEEAGIPVSVPSDEPGYTLRPRLGSIACGEPILAEEHIECYDLVPEPIRCDFTLVCRGDSMTGARIYDGDIVYIRRQPQVENGQIAAVRVGDEATLKRVYTTPQGLVLQPENPAYSPMVYTKADLDDVEILGLAVGFTSPWV